MAEASRQNCLLDCAPGRRSRRASRPRLPSLTAPAAVRRVEKIREACLGQPDDRLEFQRVEMAHPAAAEILQPQPGGITASVESHCYLGELAAHHVLIAIEINCHGRLRSGIRAWVTVDRCPPEPPSCTRV